MAAKPRVTVRLAPANLHALAYIAERDGWLPAEVARELINAGIEALLARRNWRPDWQACWAAWQAEQGYKPDRFEAPEQADYDALALGQGFPATPSVAVRPGVVADRGKPLSATIAESQAQIERIEQRLAGRKERA